MTRHQETFSKATGNMEEISFWRAGFMGALLTASILVAPMAQAQQVPRAAPLPAYTEEDAAAILNARLAALRTVIVMTADQEKLWMPLEEAIRAASLDAARRRQQRLAATESTNFLDVLSGIADAEAARSQDLRRIVQAATPFVAALTEAQRRRIPAFLGMTDHVGPAQPSAQLWIFEEEG